MMKMTEEQKMILNIFCPNGRFKRKQTLKSMKNSLEMLETIEPGDVLMAEELKELIYKIENSSNQEVYKALSEMTIDLESEEDEL